MKTTPKRFNVYFNPDLHKAPRIKAAQYEKSLSELIDQTVRWSLAEDAAASSELDDYEVYR